MNAVRIHPNDHAVQVFVTGRVCKITANAGRLILPPSRSMPTGNSRKRGEIGIAAARALGAGQRIGRPSAAKTRLRDRSQRSTLFNRNSVGPETAVINQKIE